jgi:hypothetical protein
MGKTIKPRKGEFHSLEFRPAKGGAVSTTRMKYKRGGQGGGPDYDYESQEEVHPNMQSAHDKIKAVMGDVLAELKEDMAEARTGKKV